MSASVASVANRLLEVALRCPIGARRCRTASGDTAAHDALALPPTHARMLDWQRHRDWLARQCLEYENANDRASDENDDDGDGDGNDGNGDGPLLDAITELQERLYNDASLQMRNELLVERLERNVALLNVHFPGWSKTVSAAAAAATGAVEDDNDTVEDVPSVLDDQIRAACLQRDAYTDEFLRLFNASSSNQERLRHKRQQAAALRERNQDLMDQIAQRKEAIERLRGAPSTAIHAQGLQLRRQVERNAILRHVLQLLVVSSGVDWAADADLLALMLSLKAPEDAVKEIERLAVQ